MLWSRRLLFIHVPKTGGMSLTTHLLRTLDAPVYLSIPEGHAPPGIDDRVVVVPGKRHETLAEARDLLAARGVAFEDFDPVVVVARNPYEMEVSRFFYLAKGNPWDRGRDQDLALAGDFERFALESCLPSLHLERYYTIDGHKPDTLRVLRFERLQEDFAELASAYGLPAPAALPRENATRHGPYREYFSARIEPVVYERYRFVFDAGLYPRESFA